MENAMKKIREKSCSDNNAVYIAASFLLNVLYIICFFNNRFNYSEIVHTEK